MAIAGSDLAARLFELRKQKINAGVLANKEGLSRKCKGATFCSAGVEQAGAAADCLCGVEGHFKIHNLLLFLGRGPGSISLSMASGGVHGLMCQVEKKIVLVVRRIYVGDLFSSRKRRGFATVEHDR